MYKIFLHRPAWPRDWTQHHWLLISASESFESQNLILSGLLCKMHGWGPAASSPAGTNCKKGMFRHVCIFCSDQNLFRKMYFLHGSNRSKFNMNPLHLSFLIMTCFGWQQLVLHYAALRNCYLHLFAWKSNLQYLNILNWLSTCGGADSSIQVCEQLPNQKLEECRKQAVWQRVWEHLTWKCLKYKAEFALQVVLFGSFLKRMIQAQVLRELLPMRTYSVHSRLKASSFSTMTKLFGFGRVPGNSSFRS